MGGDFWQELNIFVSSDFNINQLASLQIYNMKQPSLSLTFPLFYLSSSPPKAKLQCFHVFRSTFKMDETEEIDLFAYKPLKVTKKRASLSPTLNTPSKRRKTREGTCRKRSAAKSQKSPLPSQKGPGIVELFAQMKKTPAKVQKSLSGKRKDHLLRDFVALIHTILPVCPLCQLPLDLLRSPSTVTSRVHLNDCQVKFLKVCW